MSSRPPTITRKIYFYRIAHKEDVMSILPGEIARIGNLPFDEDGRYLVGADGDRLLVIPDSYDFPLRFRFIRTRLGGLPTKEKAGKLEDLELQEDEGLAETCHVVIYKDGLVASEFNFFGPRIKSLGTYLFAKKERLSVKPVFVPLFQHDILRIVSELSDVILFRLKGKPNASFLLKDADKDLHSAYRTLGEMGGDKLIELVLTAHPATSPKSKLLALVRKLAYAVRGNQHEAQEVLETIKIKGINSDGNIGEVDLLEDHLVSVKPMPKRTMRGKALQSEGAYEQIDAAVKEKKDSIAKAIEGHFEL